MAIVKNSIEYEPFGEVITDYAATGPAPRLGWIGKERDAETGYGNFGVRNYDFEGGRFLSGDALWEEYRGLSVYHYSASDPLRLKDPSGLAVFIYYMSSANLFDDPQGFLGHNAIGVSLSGAANSSAIRYYEAGGAAADPPPGSTRVNELRTIKLYLDADRDVYKMQLNLSKEAEEYLDTRIKDMNEGAMPPGGCCTQEVKNLLVEALEFADGLTKEKAKEKADELMPNSTLPLSTVTDPNELAKLGYVRLIIYSKDEDGRYTLQDIRLNESSPNDGNANVE